MAYIGRDIRTGAFRQLDDISSGFDGSDTTHTMQVNSTNVSVGDVNQILLSLGGVIQKPGTDFTVSGSTLTFTTAPAANTSFFAILLGSDNGGTVTPTDGSVTGDKLASNIAITTSGDTSLDGGSFVFNESSADKDFRVESNGNTHMLFVDGGNNAVGIGTGTLDAQVHILKTDSGALLDGNADNLFIEDNTTGITIGSANDGEGHIRFSDSDDADVGAIGYFHGSNYMNFRSDASEALRLTGQKVSTGAEDAPDVDAGGLTLDQNANDGIILSFKSSDVNAGGGVSGLESDTYAAYKKLSGSAGGLLTQIQSEGVDCHETRALIAEGTTNTTKSTSANAPIMFKSAENHSTGVRALSNAGTNSNLFIIADHTTRRFIFDSEGDLHSDSSNTTFDSYEDAHLVRAFDLSHGRGVIDSKFDEFVKYKHEDLANIGLVGREEDGTPNHFINITGFQRLHNGAIWQQYEKHQRLAEAVYEMAKEALGEDKADAILEKHDIKLLN